MKYKAEFFGLFVAFGLLGASYYVIDSRNPKEELVPTPTAPPAEVSHVASEVAPDSYLMTPYQVKEEKNEEALKDIIKGLDRIQDELGGLNHDIDPLGEKLGKLEEEIKESAKRLEKEIEQSAKLLEEAEIRNTKIKAEIEAETAAADAETAAMIDVLRAQAKEHYKNDPELLKNILKNLNSADPRKR